VKKQLVDVCETYDNVISHRRKTFMIFISAKAVDY